MNKEITEDLVQTRNEIRQKYLALKRGNIDQIMAQEKAFKPLIDPLKEIITEQHKPKKDFFLSSTPSKPTNVTFAPYTTPTRPYKKILKKPLLDAPSSSSLNFDEDAPSNATFLEETPPTVIQPDVGDFVLTPEPSNLLPSLQRGYTTLFQDKLGHIAGKYMKLYMAENPELDDVFGIRRQVNEDGQFVFKMGNSDLEVDKNDIKIGDKWYEGTPGLFELLVKKHPQGYTPKDLNTYRTIVLETNAHRVGNMPQNQVKGNKGQKYREIVKPMLEEKQGTSYKYWNDPNELVDRLRLLIASQEAGHSGHNNEIISIVEELKESGHVY